MNKERMIEIIQNFWGDIRMCEPENEITETLKDIKLTEEEAHFLGIESAINYIEK